MSKIILDKRILIQLNHKTVTKVIFFRIMSSNSQVYPIINCNSSEISQGLSYKSGDITWGKLKGSNATFPIII